MSDLPSDPFPPADPGPAAKPSAPAKKGPGRPKGSGSSPSAKPPGEKGPGRPSKNDVLATKLTGTFGMLGTALCLYNFGDGVAVINGAEGLAVALVHVGEDNPQVRRVLEMIVQTTAWGEVAAAVAAIVLPILANHQVIPNELATMAAGMMTTPEPVPASNGSTPS